MQFSLITPQCNITFSLFWLSQGSVAILIRWGGWSSYCHMYCSSLNLALNCIKIRWFFTNLQTKISWLFFMAHGVYIYWKSIAEFARRRIYSWLSYRPAVRTVSYYVSSYLLVSELYNAPIVSQVFFRLQFQRLNLEWQFESCVVAC